MAKILIVEDHALSRQMLNTLLGYTGHSVLKTANGEEALAIAGVEVPDLIICDILMPGMDGLELVRRLRKKTNLQRIPVIFYTATYRLPEVIHLHEIDETCRVIPKPSDPSLILQTINEVLGLPASTFASSSPSALSSVGCCSSSCSACCSRVSSQETSLRLAILMDLSFNLVSQRNPDALLKSYCRGTRELLNCQSVLLTLEEEDDKARYFWDDQQQSPGPANLSQFLPSPDILHQVVSGRQPFRWAQASAEGLEHDEQSPGVYSSLMVVPVASPSKVYGWVAFGNKEDGKVFTEEEEEMMMTIGKQVALTYENLLLIEELRKSEKRLRLALSTTGVTTWTWNLKSQRVTYWSTGTERNPATLSYTECLSFLHPEDRSRVLALFQQTLASANDYEVEFRVNCHGQESWLLSKGLVNRDGNGGAELIGINVDITERKRIEAENLASERELMKITLNSLNEGVLTTDDNARVMLVNQAAIEMLGCSEEDVLNQPLTQIFSLYNGKTGEAYTNYTTTAVYNDPILITRRGREIPVALENAPIKLQNGKEIGMVTVFQDITEKRQAQQELLKSAKLESLGVLAAGIAHDFNNILAAIISNLQLAAIQYERQSDFLPTLAQTVEISHKASALTKQLLTFAKGGAPVRKDAALDGLIQDTTEFVLRGSNIKAEYRMAKDLWAVSIDVGQISQVFHNLVLNAKQAMERGGIVTISAENVEVIMEKNLKPGKYVLVSIQDQGTGINRENMDKIFEPFFTTKANGNGLGLATAFSIIRQHDGGIEVESEENRGSTFKIYLPATTTEQTIPLATVDRETAATEDGLKILFMDDEELICQAMAELLENYGHELVATGNGDETIAAYCEAQKSNKPFDVVVLDLTIPGGMGGQEVIAELRKFDPAVKAIVSSGYAADPVMANYKKYGFAGVVSKPYRIDELLTVLAQVTAGK